MTKYFLFMDPEFSDSVEAVACVLDRESAIIFARDSAFAELSPFCCKNSVKETACVAALALEFAEMSPCPIASEIACANDCA